MVVKVYISGISGNKEVKKRQQRVLMILDSKNIKYEIIDITEPGRESDKDFMQNNSKSNGATVSDPNPRSPLPPQIFNEEEYCGDYDQFDLANELDTLEQFLKLEIPSESSLPEENKVNTVNGDSKSKENSQERETTERVAEEAEDTPKDEKPAEETKEEETSKESPEGEKNGAEREKTPEETEKPPEEIESNVLKDVTTMSNTDVVSSKNGSVSSREASQEKEAEDKVAGSREASQEKAEIKEKESPSETLIQSERATAAE